MNSTILRIIFGPAQDDEQYTIRTKHELENLIEGANISGLLKSESTGCVTCVERRLLGKPGA